MIIKLLMSAMFVLAMSGCASDDYTRYTMAHTAMQTARSNAEAQRYKALSDIANSGDSTAKVAAVIALMAQNGGNQPAPHINAPKSGWDYALQWAQVLVPAASQSFGMYSNMVMATTASNNARDTSISTNQSFVGIAGKIQAPITTTTNTDSHNTDSHAVTTDNHAVSTDSHAVDSTTLVPAKVCTTNTATGEVVCQ